MTLSDAVLDALLPGASDMPTATAAGIEIEKHAALLAPIAAAAARAAGGENAFIDSDEARRTAILQSVQADRPDDFACLLAALLPDYYESPQVLKAFGWTERPPQPQGHAIPQMDGPTTARLEKVRLRRKLWRDV
jgi:hypothetical protein